MAKNVIVLSPNTYDDIDYVKTIKPNVNRMYGERYLDRDLFLRRTYEKKWDFVSWLNCEENNNLCEQQINAGSYEMKNVTFIIKTFERFKCVKRLVNSIYRYYPDAIILIGDDSEISCKQYFAKHYTGKDLTVYVLPKDCGLSYGRNYLLDRVKTDYFVLLDDDFVFDKRTDIQTGISILSEKGLDILGGYFRNYSEVYKFTDNFKVLIRHMFHLEIPYNYIGKLMLDKETRILNADYITKEFPDFTLTDITHNFFIGRTNVIRTKNRWDDDLKLHEHTDFFLRGKANGLSVGFTNQMSVQHKPIKPKKYNDFRNRDFVKLFMEKNDIKKIVATYNGKEEKVTEYT